MYDMSAKECWEKARFRQNNIDWLMYDIDNLTAEKVKLEKVCFQLCRDVRHGEIYRRMSSVVYDQIQELECQLSEMWSDVYQLEYERDMLWEQFQEQSQTEN